VNRVEDVQNANPELNVVLAKARTQYPRKKLRLNAGNRESSSHLILW